MLGEWTEGIAIGAACTHVLGYCVYISLVRRGVIEANPLSWLMFAYGTALLSFLEYRTGASWRELLLPVACSVSSAVVAALCIRPSRLGRLAFSDVFSFAIDVLLTAVYVAIWIAQGRGLNEASAEIAVIGLLISANAATVASFAPILRSTYEQPDHERVAPWILWTLAYGLLLVVTLKGSPSASAWPLLLYPGLNAIFHFAVAVLAASRWWRPKSRVTFEVQETESTGLGVFTPRGFGRGERVFVLRGKVRRIDSRDTTDASENPNWFGIGKDVWIDPDAPFMFLNHSCEPNLGVRGERDFVALRDIAPGEELTVDYSITEVDEHWNMTCQCGARTCRRTIGSIHTLPYEVFLRYLPYVGGHFRHAYLRQRAKARSKSKQQELRWSNPPEHTLTLETESAPASPSREYP